jgi:hypothetical protein
MADFDPNDLTRLNQMPALGPFLASNAGIGGSYPGPSFQQMPAPLERGAPQVEDLPPEATRAPPASVTAAPDPDPEQANDEEDKVSSSNSDGKNPLNDLLISKDDLKNAADAKKRAMLFGALADGLGNQQSVGNFMLGQLNPKNDSSGWVQQMSKLSDLPIEQKRTLLQQAIQDPQMEMKIAAGNPNSAVSKISSAAAQAYAQKNGMDPEAFKGKSFNEINAVAPGAMEALGKENAMLNHYKMMADMMGQRIQTQKDNQTMHAGDAFDNDKVIEPLVARRNQIALDKHTLQTADVITPSMLFELGQGMANALQGGKGAGFHAADLSSIKDAQNDLAKAESYIAGKPYNALSPEYRKYLDDTFSRLDQGYSNAISARAQAKRQGRNFSSNPAANAAMDAKVKEYSQGAGDAGGNSGPVKMIAPDGSLRMIPPDQVDAAKAAGGKVAP